MGGGVSGQVALRGTPATGGDDAQLQRLSVAPGVAPWVGARVGIPGSNEAGLAYTGRTIRADARHAFSLGAPTLSIGLGASAVVARRIAGGDDDDGSSVYGGGFDVPLLLGLKSRGDLYSFWFGPRAGLELLSGRVATAVNGEAPKLVDATGRHIFAGFLAGLRVGFRHVFVAIEVNGAYHRADGKFDGAPVGLYQFTVTPSGALEVTF